MNGDADWQDLAAEYVLGTLDAAERAEAAALIAADADFAALVSAWEQRLGELSAMVAPVDPPPELWTAIQERLAADASADGTSAIGTAGAGAALAITGAAQLEHETIEAAAPEAEPGAVPFAGAAAAAPGDAAAAPEEAAPDEAAPGDGGAEKAADAAPTDLGPEPAASEDAVPLEHSSTQTGAAETGAVESTDGGGVEPEGAPAAETPAPAGPEEQAAAAEIVQAEQAETATADKAAAAEAISAESNEAPVAESEVIGTDATGPERESEPAAAAPEIVEVERPAAEVAPDLTSDPGAPTPEIVEAESPAEVAPGLASEPEADASGIAAGESPAAVGPDLFELDAAFHETAKRIAAEAEAKRTEGAEGAPASLETAAGVAAREPMAGPPDALMAELPVAVETATVPARDQSGSGEPSDAADLASRMRRWRGLAAIFGALAAGLAAILVTSARAPQYLPEALRPRSEIRTIEVPRDVVRTVTVPSASAGRFVAVLQSNGAIPAFIITANVAQRALTVRRVAAESQADHSYELWLISNRFQEPRSLGVIGTSEFTHPPTLAAYDPETISDATFAVSLEPEGGSTTGQPSGPMLFSGKLVEAVPASVPARAPTAP